MSSARFVGRIPPGTLRRAMLRALLVFPSLTMAVLAMPPAVRAEAQIGWRQAAAPGGRSGASMAYDSVRGKVVLFGGECTNPVPGQQTSYGDTWEWDGAWRLVATTGPAPRKGAMMAYDASRGRTLLFGGAPDSTGTAHYGDTWEWDGTSWTQVASTGPSPRESGGMAYDSARRRIVLYGGFDGSSLVGDTWEWDGSAWTQVKATGPASRYRVGMVYDSQRGKVLLFGGVSASGERNDTWEWDGTAWARVALTGPSARGTSMAYDSARGKAVLFSGSLGYSDTWEWDGTAWTRVATTGPRARMHLAIAYDAARRQTLLFGGWDWKCYGDTWTWDGTQWTQAALQPGALTYPAMAHDSARGKTVLFGGYSSGYPVADTWEWDGGTWRLAASTGPSPRGRAGMAFDARRGRTILFGGTTSAPGSAYSGETWEWDGAVWTLAASEGPAPRCDVAMAYDRARDRIVLFGGYSTTISDTTYYGDTWEWDGSAWSPVATSGPAPRASGAMAYDVARKRCVLFGGYKATGSSTTYCGDTWEWDGNAWSQVASTGPSARTRTAIAHDSARGRTVLFGGASAPITLGDTWEWDGSAWTKVETAGPPPRSSAAMAFDSDRGQCVLFGGSALADTWLYGPMAVAPSPFTLDEAIRALQCAAGLITLSEDDRMRCDIEAAGASAGCVDVCDAIRIARKVASLEPNP